MAWGYQGPTGLQGIQTGTAQPSAASGVQTGTMRPAPAPTASPGAPATPATTPAGSPLPTPTPLPALAQNPTYLEFTRSLGLSQADAQAAADRATANVGARLGNTLAQNAQTNQLGLENTAGRLEGRGIANSGEALRDIANQRAQQAFREEALRQQASNQIEQLATNLAMNMQRGDVQLGNLGLSQAPADFIAANPVAP